MGYNMGPQRAVIELNPFVGRKVADAAVVKRFASQAYQFGSPSRVPHITKRISLTRKGNEILNSWRRRARKS